MANLRQCPFKAAMTTVGRRVPSEDTKTLVQAFISCHMDYCNLPLYGLSTNTCMYSRCRMLRRG